VRRELSIHLPRLPVGYAPFGERLEQLPRLILSDRLAGASAGGVNGHASMPIDKKAMATGHMAQPTVVVFEIRRLEAERVDHR